MMLRFTEHVTWPTGDVNGPWMDLYKNFPLVVSERWQQEVTENVFDMINEEMDEIEQKRKHSPQLVISQTTMKSPQSLTPYTLTLHWMNSPVINPSHPGELTTIIINTWYTKWTHNIEHTTIINPLHLCQLYILI